MCNISVSVSFKYSEAKIKLFLIHFSTYKANSAIFLVYLYTYGTKGDIYGL